MIPLRDTVPSARPALVSWALVATNVAVFVYELSLGPRAEAFFSRWGLVPASFEAVDLLTSMFIHGGVMHLGVNMLFLWIFGDNIEDRLGHGRYLVFYLLCGVAAGSVQALLNPASDVPMVGASGAISGVAGAYLLFFPRSRIVTIVPVFFFLQVLEVPAVVFLLLWFAFQVVSGVATFGADEGVAFWAHVGGFVAGVVLGPVLGAGARGRRGARN